MAVGRRLKGSLLTLLLLIASCVSSVCIILWYVSLRRVPVSVWLTEGENPQIRLQPLANVSFLTGAGNSRLTITMDTRQTYQEIDGFGAALTDSAAWLLHEVLNDSTYEVVMDALFHPVKGIGLSVVRVPMGASDCARSWYSYDDTPPNLDDFTISHDESYILPVLQDALTRNPTLKVIASPFSAPGWMKVDNNMTDPATRGLIGGTLNVSYLSMYADYFVKFVRAYAARGVPVYAVTLQNEPFHIPTDYPGMSLNVTQQIGLAWQLGVKFQAAGLDTKILVLDHNWDLFEEALAIINDPAAGAFINGVAWHGYSSPPDPSLQSRVHEVFPEKEHYFTEVSGFRAAPNFADNLAWLYSNVFVGSTRHWSRAALLWNLALNASGGPILRPYYGLRGVVTVSETSREVTCEVEYYALAHVSKFVGSGTRRVYSTTLPGTLETVGFLNPDGSQTLVISNPSTGKVRFNLQWADHFLPMTLASQSVITLHWI